jgi:D-psicose/D-tagatose/L-ribulose 3-epimerase
MHVAESNRRVPKGGGFVPWGDLARGLKDIGYDRIVSLEPLSKLGGSVARDAKMWRQTIPDVSDEALERDIVEGLHFIKSAMEGARQ